MNVLQSKILVVEDEVINRLYLANLLRNQGYEVVESADGADALEIVQNGKFNAVIADIGLPGLNGVELIKKIRLDINNKDICIVVATAHACESDHIEFKNAGADVIIVKPFDENKLLEMIEKYIG